MMKMNSHFALRDYSLLPQAGLREGRCTAAGNPPAYLLRVKGAGMRVFALKQNVFQLNAPHPSPLPPAGEGMKELRPAPFKIRLYLYSSATNWYFCIL